MVKLLLAYLFWCVIGAAAIGVYFIGVFVLDKFGIREEFIHTSMNWLTLIGGLFVLYFVVKYLFILFAWTSTW